MRWFAALSLLSVFSVLLVAMEPGKENPRAAPKLPSSNRDLLMLVAQRGQLMKRVTEHPYTMDLAVATLCYMPPSLQKIMLPENNPHQQHDIHVYVTPTGEEVLRTGKGTYPVGTLIVKEKLPATLPARLRYGSLDLRAQDKQVKAEPGDPKASEQAVPRVLPETKEVTSPPEIFTVMLKREAGYNKECGDWEFLVFDGKLQHVLARGKLDSCVECHLDYKQTDFVTRRYIPVQK